MTVTAPRPAVSRNMAWPFALTLALALTATVPVSAAPVSTLIPIWEKELMVSPTVMLIAPEPEPEAATLIPY